MMRQSAIKSPDKKVGGMMAIDNRMLKAWEKCEFCNLSNYQIKAILNDEDRWDELPLRYSCAWKRICQVGMKTGFMRRSGKWGELCSYRAEVCNRPSGQPYQPSGWDESRCPVCYNTKDVGSQPNLYITKEKSMLCTAWNNGSNCESGSGYGLKLKESDRDANFQQTWTDVILELPMSSGTTTISVNINKKSFWSKTCHELIAKEIGIWLLEQKLAPWPKGLPPTIELTPQGGNRFRVSAIINIE